MGVFIGYGDVGVWASNRERDAFLDWFADNRYALDDPRRHYCQSEAQQWMGYCIDLEDLIPRGEHLGLTGEEYSAAAVNFRPDVAQLLGIIDSITRGEWLIRIDMEASCKWMTRVRTAQPCWRSTC